MKNDDNFEYIFERRPISQKIKDEDEEEYKEWVKRYYGNTAEGIKNER